jgi:hypothetical protein
MRQDIPSSQELHHQSDSRDLLKRCGTRRNESNPEKVASDSLPPRGKARSERVQERIEQKARGCKVKRAGQVMEV